MKRVKGHHQEIWAPFYPQRLRYFVQRTGDFCAVPDNSEWLCEGLGNHAENKCSKSQSQHSGRRRSSKTNKPNFLDPHLTKCGQWLLNQKSGLAQRPSVPQVTQETNQRKNREKFLLINPPDAGHKQRNAWKEIIDYERDLHKRHSNYVLKKTYCFVT